jgi:hypothetical protein
MGPRTSAEVKPCQKAAKELRKELAFFGGLWQKSQRFRVVLPGSGTAMVPALGKIEKPNAYYL